MAQKMGARPAQSTGKACAPGKSSENLGTERQARRHHAVVCRTAPAGTLVCQGAGRVGGGLIPIDLIPDFIPVLGCVDDLLLLPGMIWLAIRLIPAPVLQQCRDQADLWIKTSGGKPTSRIGAVLVVAVWMGAGLALWHWLAA